MELSIWFVVLIFTAENVLSNTLRKKRSGEGVPCDHGWFFKKDKCYKVGGKTERVNWETAAGRCKNWGGSLVTVRSKEEQEFIIAIVMLEVRESVWMGLNDRDNESVYIWDGGDKSDYRNWEDGEPSGIKQEHEDCVQMVIDLYRDVVGGWNDNNCQVGMAYVCQMNANTNKRSPNPQYCSAEVGGGFKLGRSCYHLVAVPKSWEEAEEHCQHTYGGHLITILDNAVDYYLDYFLQTTSSGIWIGIKIQDQFQQKWTSGWFVAYDGFKKEPRDFLEGTCVVRTKRKLWSIVPCSRQNVFICENSQDKAPVLPLPIKDSYCPKVPEGWRDLDGENCYFIETSIWVNWYEANFHCIRRGGHLLSVHSKAENKILHPFIRYSARFAAYGGLFRLLGKDNTFGWSDGSPMDFINWSPNEPNREDEKCVELQSSDMKWNDISCEEKRPFICSVKKVVPNSTIPDESDSQTDCPDSISLKALIGVVVCIILVLILMGIVVYCFRPCNMERRKASTAIGLPPASPTAINRQKYRSAELRIKEESYYEDMDT